MAVGRRIDQSFLGESALRLARLLGLGGLISPQFDSGEKIIPIVKVGDATQIGYRGEALRAFSYGETVPAAAGFTSKLAIKAPLTGNGIIIDGFLVSSAGANPVKIGMLDPETADPWVIAQTNALWVERMKTAAERSGILTAPQNGDALDYGLDFMRFFTNNTAPVLIPCPVMLLPGAKVIVGNLTVNLALTVGFWGRAL